MTIFSSPPCSADYLDGNQEALHCVGDGAVEQVAHRGYGVFILEALQNWPGHGPGLPTLVFPAWVGLDQMTSRGPFQP